ncbi:MAG: hypothetical protein J5733_06050, partial [Bacteroidaceae bacterium]|nr:hypothetical protein [Bacteroidaceae bacterium]
IFGAVTVPEEQVAVRCYSEKNYKGYCVALPEGEFTQSDLAVYGLKAKDLSSLEIVDEYYQVRLYSSTNCTGGRTIKRKSSKTLGTYNNAVCSMIVEPNPTAIKTIDNGQRSTDNRIYNLAGQRLQKEQKGINIINGKKVFVK